MDLYDSIAQRKSCRNYRMQALGQDFLGEVEAAIASFEPLYPTLPIKYRFTAKVKGRFHVGAPHYLIAEGTGDPGELENIGFVFEQLVLWFDAHEIGSVWLGSSRDAEISSKGNDVLAIGFGHVTDSVHRSKEEFKRRPINEITNAPEDFCIQAAHLAPSGMNTQPWYFEKREGKVLLYQQKLKPPISLLYHHSDEDMGIGLSHYALAKKEQGGTFHFMRNTALPEKPGYRPFGIIS